MNDDPSSSKQDNLLRGLASLQNSSTSIHQWILCGFALGLTIHEAVALHGERPYMLTLYATMVAASVPGKGTKSRNWVIFIVALSLTTYEAFISKSDGRPFLLTFYGAMMGLPLFLTKVDPEKRREPSDQHPTGSDEGKSEK